MSNELIPILSRPVGDEINSVDARELHATLESKRPFATWFNDKIPALGFVEGVDYLRETTSPNGFADGNRGLRLDVFVTLDAAKHLALAERTETGKKVRAYFIEAEKRLRAASAPALPNLYDPEQVAKLLAHSLTVLTEERTKRLAAETALADAAPKVEFVDRYVVARGNVGLRLAAKILGQRQYEFVDWLLERGFVYRTSASKSRRTGKERAGVILPYAGYEAYFEVKTLLTEHEDGDRQRQQTMITPLGITWLAKKLGVQPDMEAA